MLAHLPRAAPPIDRDHPIAPQHLWGYLSLHQQQQVRQVLIGVAQQMMAHRPCPPSTEEPPDES